MVNIITEQTNNLWKHKTSRYTKTVKIHNNPPRTMETIGEALIYFLIFATDKHTGGNQGFYSKEIYDFIGMTFIDVNIQSK